MIIILKHNASSQSKSELRKDLEAQGFVIHVSDGINASLFGVVGDTVSLDVNKIYAYDCVDKVMRITESFRGGFRPERGLIEWSRLSVAIVGLGLMGGSFARAFRRFGVAQIIGVEQNPDILAEAQRLGVIDIPLTEPGPALRRADIVILAIYPEAMVSCVQAMLPHFKENVIITDIAGIKNDMIGKIQNILPDTMEFISGHPMAGKQASGLSMSDANIFHDANYVIVPSDKNTAHGIAWLETMAKNLGCRYTVRVSPDEHDRIIAYTSDLPHITAVALMDSISYDERIKFFMAGSFRDGTRVADINPELWCDLFMANKEKVADELDHYIEQLEIWRRALRSGDMETMKSLMQQSKDRCKELH